jgi:hypothetical protein
VLSPDSLEQLGDAADLFAEDAFGARRRQVAFLRRQPGGLWWMSSHI